MGLVREVNANGARDGIQADTYRGATGARAGQRSAALAVAPYDTTQPAQRGGRRRVTAGSPQDYGSRPAVWVGGEGCRRRESNPHALAGARF